MNQKICAAILLPIISVVLSIVFNTDHLEPIDQNKNNLFVSPSETDYCIYQSVCFYQDKLRIMEIRINGTNSQ